MYGDSLIRYAKTEPSDPTSIIAQVDGRNVGVHAGDRVTPVKSVVLYTKKP